MKYYLFIVPLMIIELSLTYAQENLYPIKTPTSPAASILDINPGTILTPKSTQALEAGIYSNFTNDGKISLPDNFSMEFSPYWFKNHKLKLNDYLFPNNMIEQLIRTSSFSIISSQNFIFEDSTKSTSIGLGYRASYYFGNKKDKQRIGTLKRDLNTDQAIKAEMIASATRIFLDRESQNIDTFISLIIPHISQILETNKINEELINQFIVQIGKDLKELGNENLDIKNISLKIRTTYENFFNSDSKFNSIKSYIKNRYGLYVDLAYANFVNFPTNNLEFSIIPKQSFWITPTYQFNGILKGFKAIGVLRYQWNNIDYYKKYFPGKNIYINNVDYGMAIIGELNRASIQLEVVGRRSNTELNIGQDSEGNLIYTKKKESDIQYMSTVSYRLTDQIALSYKLGKNFKNEIISKNNLISILSLNMAFGIVTKDNF